MIFTKTGGGGEEVAPLLEI